VPPGQRARILRTRWPEGEGSSPEGDHESVGARALDAPDGAFQLGYPRRSTDNRTVQE